MPLHEAGWRNFDVTQAVHYWSKSQKKTPLHLEVWIEGERPGRHAAEMAKRVRFTTQHTPESNLDTSAGTPELVLYTLNLDEYGYVYLKKYYFLLQLILPFCSVCSDKNVFLLTFS